MPNQYGTTWAQQQHDADGGLAASLASSHEQVAPVLRNLPDNLVAAGTDQYLYAIKGTDAERHAAIDAWAAAHHVTAEHREGIGYYAKISLGAISVLAIAIPEKRLASAA